MTDPTPTPLPEGPTTAPARRLPAWAWIASGAALVAVIAAAVGISFAVAANAASPFEDAMSDCDVPSSSWARVGDEGNTLILDGEGGDSDGLSLANTVCIMTGLDVPDSTIAKIEGTRALDGVQSDTYGDITVEWSYHPDNGLDLIFTR